MAAGRPLLPPQSAKEGGLAKSTLLAVALSEGTRVIYTGKLAALQEGLSRLSYDETALVCGNDGCTNHVNQMLVVPGE